MTHTRQATSGLILFCTAGVAGCTIGGLPDSNVAGTE